MTTNEQHAARLESARASLRQVEKRNEELRLALGVAHRERDEVIAGQSVLYEHLAEANAHIDRAESAIGAAQADAARLREALVKIAQDRGCGCKPICQCRTEYALKIELEERKSIAHEALKALATPSPTIGEIQAEALEKLRDRLFTSNGGLHDIASLRQILTEEAARLRGGGK